MPIQAARAPSSAWILDAWNDDARFQQDLCKDCSPILLLSLALRRRLSRSSSRLLIHYPDSSVRAHHYARNLRPHKRKVPLVLATTQWCQPGPAADFSFNLHQQAAAIRRWQCQQLADKLCRNYNTTPHLLHSRQQWICKACIQTHVGILDAPWVKIGVRKGYNAGLPP